MIMWIGVFLDHVLGGSVSHYIVYLWLIMGMRIKGLRSLASSYNAYFWDTSKWMGYQHDG